MPKEIDKEFWGPISGAVAGEYSQKLEKFDTVRQRLSMPGDWQRLMYTAGPGLRKAGEVKQLLTRVGAPGSISELGFTRERLRRAILHMHEIRARFTVVDLAWTVGILPEKCDELIDEWLL